MQFYSVWVYFAAVGLLLLIVSLAPFASLDSPPGSGGKRMVTLDGLRGYLAISVVVHHGAVYHDFLASGLWVVPPSRFFAMLGQSGVAMFFMVTGYLFWGRLIRNSGRVDWWAFYAGRVFRIGPIYLLSVGLMLVGTGIVTGWTLHSSVWRLARDLAVWLPLGYAKGGSVNGFVGTGQLLAYVVWSLHYEWLFYFWLPVLGLVLRRGVRHDRFAFGLLALTVIVGLVVVHSIANYVVLFAVGMASASLRARQIADGIPDRVASAICLVALAAAVTLFDTAYRPVPALLIGIAFHLIASGCSVFGLMTLRAAQRLGNISYGIYLMQGLALALMLQPAPFHALALSGPAQHWGLVMVALVILTATAGAAHRLVELPGIRLGRSVGRWRPRLGSEIE